MATARRTGMRMTGTHTPDACVGVVLAGGRSRRMGRDKALLDWHGRTWLAHAIDRFHAAGIANVAVSGDRPAHAGIADLHADAGPLAGLLAVARVHPGRWLVVAPVDMPALPAALLAQLAEGRGQAAALHYAGFPLPLAFRSDDEALAMLEARLACAGRDARSLHAWLSARGARPLPPPGGAELVLADADTPGEWEAIAR